MEYRKIEDLRKLCITPEKYDYLFKYFMDIDGEITEKTNFKKEVKKAINNAKNYMKEIVTYKYGKPKLTVFNFASKPTDDSLGFWNCSIISLSK